ncbi:MAG: hypothetical protein MHM6MM_006102 [Cercozoa sp. M6MM]
MAIKKSKKSSQTVFTIKCEKPVADSFLQVDQLVQYLQQKIKVDGVAGALGDVVAVEASGSNVLVKAKGEFSKRSLKYYTKKFLKKNQLRDYLRVIADSKASYELRYYNNEAAETN